MEFHFITLTWVSHLHAWESDARHKVQVPLDGINLQKTQTLHITENKVAQGPN